jgi:hypothetical protein
LVFEGCIVTVPNLTPENLQRLTRLAPGSLEHLPPYAFNAALNAILKVKALEESRLLREGLCYIVLTDLSGATISSARLGKEETIERIESFLQAAMFALQDIEFTNVAFFLKDVGDAALFIFSAFVDVLEWHDRFNEHLNRSNEQYSAYEQPDLWVMRAKTIVHLGEVAFSNQRDPVAQAVNQIFKVEKNFGPDQLGCTDPVLRVVGPIIRERDIKVVPAGEQILPGDSAPTSLWQLIETSDQV